MKYARYLAHGQVSYGVLEGDTLREITTTPFEEYQITDHAHGLSEVKLLPPTSPTKILAVGLNHVSRMHDVPPLEVPLIFLKAPSCLIGHGDAIIRPREVEFMEEEGEMVVVIGRRCRNVSEEAALDYVLGYTCGNDVSAKEGQGGDNQSWRTKSTDAFSPVGPYISDEVDPGNAMVRAGVNGKEVQADSTSGLVFDVPTIISRISRRQTLEPGDLIFTGTPTGATHLNPGDTVEIEIEGIGVLSNPVRME